MGVSCVRGCVLNNVVRCGALPSNVVTCDKFDNRNAIQRVVGLFRRELTVCKFTQVLEHTVDTISIGQPYMEIQYNGDSFLGGLCTCQSMFP